MDDEAAFLRAIRATPDDDTPRLVFADWLDEHEQPERAEFIRAQIELAQLELASIELRQLDPIASQWSDRAFLLDAITSDLWHRHAWDWIGDVPGANLLRWDLGRFVATIIDGGQIYEAGYVPWRGFVDHVLLPPEAFTEKFARQLLAAAPITRVLIHGRDEAHSAERLEWARSLVTLPA